MNSFVVIFVLLFQIKIICRVVVDILDLTLVIKLFKVINVALHHNKFVISSIHVIMNDSSCTNRNASTIKYDLEFGKQRVGSIDDSECTNGTNGNTASVQMCVYVYV